MSSGCKISAISPWHWEHGGALDRYLLHYRILLCSTLVHNIRLRFIRICCITLDNIITFLEASAPAYYSIMLLYSMLYYISYYATFICQHDMNMTILYYNLIQYSILYYIILDYTILKYSTWRATSSGAPSTRSPAPSRTMLTPS